MALLETMSAIAKMSESLKVISVGAHDIVHWENAPKWYTASCYPDDPDSFISLLLILLSALVLLYAYKSYICLPISAHGL